jgi:hypothetical protein
MKIGYLQKEDLIMNEIIYLNMSEMKIPSVSRNVIKYAVLNEDLWMWKPRKFNNHDMALILVNILYRRKQINEATYRKIMNRNKLQYLIA